MILKKTALATVIALSLTACGSGGGSSAPAKPQNNKVDNTDVQAIKNAKEKTQSDKEAKDKAEAKAQQLQKEKLEAEQSAQKIAKERKVAEQKANEADKAKQIAAQALDKEQRAKQQAEELTQRLANEKAQAEQHLAQLAKEKAEAEKLAKQNSSAKAEAEAKAQQEQQAKEQAEANLARLMQEKEEAEKLAQNLQNQRVEAEKQAREAELAKAEIEKRIAQDQQAKSEAEETITRLESEKVEAEKEAQRLRTEREEADKLAKQRIEEAKQAQTQRASQAVIDRLKGIDSRAYDLGLNTSPFLEDYTKVVDGYEIVTRRSGKKYIYNQPYSVITGELTKENIRNNEHQINEPKFGTYYHMNIQGLATVKIPTEGKATYNGKAFNADYQGNFTYDVDFSNKIGSGTISQLGNAPDLILNEGKITKLGIESKIKGGNMLPDRGELEYYGGYNLKFFGSNAEEVAGTGWISQYDKDSKILNLVPDHGESYDYSSSRPFGFGGTRGEIIK